MRRLNAGRSRVKLLETREKKFTDSVRESSSIRDSLLLSLNFSKMLSGGGVVIEESWNLDEIWIVY